MIDIQTMRINECFAEDCKYNEDGKCIYYEGIGIDIDEDGQCLMYEREE